MQLVNGAQFLNITFLLVLFIGQTGKGGTKEVEIMVPLTYLSNFWRTIEMPLLNSEIRIQLKLSKDCVLVPSTAANQNLEFKITDTKLNASVVILSTQDNVKLLNN